MLQRSWAGETRGEFPQVSDFSSLGEVTIVLAIPSPMVFPVSWQEHDGHEQLWVLCPKAWALQISSGISACGQSLWKSWSMLKVMQLEGK